MPRLAAVISLVWPHLAAPGVSTDSCDLGAVDPIGSLEGQTWGIAPGISTPLAAGQTVLHLPSSDNYKIPPTDIDSLLASTTFKIVHCYRHAIFEIWHAKMSRDVEQYAAANHAIFDFFYTVSMSAI